jgi:hypothetical protein
LAQAAQAALLRQRMLQMATLVQTVEQHRLAHSSLQMALREAAVALQLLDQADLASFKVTEAHQPAHLGRVALLECLLRLPQLRNLAEHQVHPVEELQLLMLPVLALLEAGR